MKQNTRKTTRRGAKRTRRAAQRHRTDARPEPQSRCTHSGPASAQAPDDLEQQILLWVGMVHTGGSDVSPEPAQVCAVRARKALKVLRDCALRSPSDVTKRMDALRAMRAALRNIMAAVSPSDTDSMERLGAQHLSFHREISALRTALDYAAHGRMAMKASAGIDADAV